MLVKSMIVAGLMLAAGIGGALLPHDGGTRKPAQPATPSSSPTPSPASADASRKELEALRAELKDAQDRISLLRKEIAEQNLRRQALEASLKTKDDAIKAMAEADAFAKAIRENQSHVQKAMRTLVDAEATYYHNSCPDKGGRVFCYNLANLCDQADANGNPILLIDAELASGRKNGYRYGACATYNANGDRDKGGFAYYAVPEVYLWEDRPQDLPHRQ